MNFHEIGIPTGSILISTENPSITARVLDERKVEFQGKPCSLTAATRKVLGLSEEYALQPSPYWTFNGRTVKAIYDEFHDTADEA